MLPIVLFIMIISLQSVYCMTEVAQAGKETDKTKLRQEIPKVPAKPYDESKRISLHDVIQKNNTKLLETVLKCYKSMVNTPNTEGYPPLHWAIQSLCSLEVIQVLLKAGALPNEKTSAGNTALHCAVLLQNCSVDLQRGIVRELILAEADTEAKNSNNCTPVQLATVHADWITLDNASFEEIANLNYIALTVIPQALKDRKMGKKDKPGKA